MNEVYIACSRFYCGWMDEKGINESLFPLWKRDALYSYKHRGIQFSISKYSFYSHAFIIIIIINSKLNYLSRIFILFINIRVSICARKIRYSLYWPWCEVFLINLKTHLEERKEGEIVKGNVGISLNFLSSCNYWDYLSLSFYFYSKINCSI